MRRGGSGSHGCASETPMNGPYSMPPRRQRAGTRLTPDGKVAFLMPGLRDDGPWWGRVHPVYWVPAVLVFVLVLLLPDDPAALPPGVLGLVRVLLDVAPFLGGHAAVSTLPQLITIVKALTFALIPVVALLPFLFVWKGRHRCLLLNIQAGLPVPWWLEAMCALCLVLAFVGNWMVAPDPGLCPGCTTDSRLGMAAINAASLLVYSLFPIGLASSLYVRLGMAFGIKEMDDE